MALSRATGGAGQSDPSATSTAAGDDRTRLARLHESLATLLASRGQWRDAYEHLRSSLDLLFGAREAQEAASPDELRREVARLRKERAEAREQSLRDSLTASYNRRYLEQRLHHLLSNRPAGTGLAVALVDLDFFKQVNDTYGHLLGDQVLQRVVEVLQDGLPEGAFCARYGGEEFVLVLPGMPEAAAVRASEQARARVEQHPWSQLVTGLRVTVSIGVAHRTTSPADPDPTASVPDMLLSADRLLYRAKQAGRNAVAFRTANGVALAGNAAHRRGAGLASA